jgi:predicted TIM-barrel fold metal-dependent hydrolase
MIIDFHTHIFPDALAARALATLAARAQVPPRTDGTAAGLLAAMRPAGVARAVVAPIATKPAQARAINAWAVETSTRYPMLTCFGSLHPAQEDWRDEIARLRADGILGVKFHPDYQQFFVDEPRMLPIYRALAAAGVIALCHAGVDIGLPPPVHCTPDGLARVLDAVPQLTIVAGHMGGYAQWDAVERLLLGRALYLDTSYSLTDLGPERMAAMIARHGAEHVLFGTDSPWTDQAEEIAGIRRLALPENDITAILGENAHALLAARPCKSV